MVKNFLNQNTILLAGAAQAGTGRQGSENSGQSVYVVELFAYVNNRHLMETIISKYSKLVNLFKYIISRETVLK